LLLLENEHLRGYGRPARFGPADDSPPVGQFREWPAIWEAAAALGLHRPGARIRDTVLAVTGKLGEQYPVDQVRRLPLSSVVALLRRAIAQRGKAEEAETPTPPGVFGSESGGADAVGCERGAAGSLPGATAEERVGRCLADSPAASMAEVTSRTGLREQVVRRTPTWKGHEEALLDEYLRGRPEATAADAAAAIQCSPPKVVGMKPWKDLQARRQAAEPPTRVKDRPLTRRILEVRPDAGSADLAARFEDRDEIFVELRKGADPDTRKRLQGLDDSERRALVDHLSREVLENWQGRDPEATFAVLLLAAQAWLEDQVEEGRRQASDEQRRRRH
jgi:hypothetical protein